MTRRTYFKATSLDGTDFHTGTVHYQVGQRVTHPTATRRTKGDPATYLSVATVPTDCTGFKWPCRLYEVHGVGQAMTHPKYPNKRAFSAVDIAAELPAWQVFGPQGETVAALVDRCRHITSGEAQRLAAAWVAAWGTAQNDARVAARDAAWDAARVAARGAAWGAAWVAARGAARGAARDAAGVAAWVAAWGAARDAALGFLVRDLIGPDQFDTLTGPLLFVIGDPDTWTEAA